VPVGQWDSLTVLPESRQEAVAGAVGEDFYVFGGGPNRQTAYWWDGSSWTAVSNLPAIRRDWAAASDETDIIYLVGGRNADSSLTPESQIWGYSTSGDSYDTGLASMSVPRFDHGAVYHDGQVFVFGGTTTGSANTDSVEVYDIAGDSWSSATSIPAQKSSFAYAKSGHHALLISGYEGSGFGTLVPTVRRYDLDADSWDTVADYPHSYEGIAAAPTRTGSPRIVAAGGNPPAPTDVAYVWMSSADTWVDAGVLPTGAGVVYMAAAAGESSAQFFGGRTAPTPDTYHARYRLGGGVFVGIYVGL
jgi:hypothetical protein